MYSDDAISPDSLRRFIGQANTPQAMKAVAKSLEAVFAYELVKEMWATAGSDNKDFANQTYTSMFNMQLADLWAQQGMGLESVIIKQLEHEKPGGKTEGSARKPHETDGKIDSAPALKGRAFPEGRTSAPGILNAPSGQDDAPGKGTPVKGASGGETGEKIKNMIRAAFGGQAANAMAVLYAESSGNPDAVHVNAFYGSTDCGLFQINDRFWAQRLERNGIINNVSDLFDPRKNIEAAAWIYKHGGWGQWTSVREGRVRIGPPDIQYAENVTWLTENVPVKDLPGGAR